MRSAAIGIPLALLMLASALFYARFPVYTKENVTALVERDVPTGTSRAQVASFLEALKDKDVLRASVGQDVSAYFPSSILMRGWHYIRVIFHFKSGKVTRYEVQPINI